VYSYNRGMTFPDDLDEKLYRPNAKVCIFNKDLTPDPKAKKQIKLEDLKDEVLLSLWEG